VFTGDQIKNYCEGSTGKCSQKGRSRREELELLLKPLKIPIARGPTQVEKGSERHIALGEDSRSRVPVFEDSIRRKQITGEYYGSRGRERGVAGQLIRFTTEKGGKIARGGNRMKLYKTQEFGKEMGGENGVGSEKILV